MKLITAKDIAAAFHSKNLLQKGFETLQEDLGRWDEFEKTPRHAFYRSHGVFELMPCCDDQYYTYKYVNCHPDNPKQNKSSVVALGMLADIETGYPQMVCDMTLLTAIRTAVTSAITAKYLANPKTKSVGFIGNGAQVEFQLLALSKCFNIETVKYFDIDPKAMEKFHRNCAKNYKEFIPCKNAYEVTQDVDIITTAINAKQKIKLIEYDWIKNRNNLFINAMGGDCPGKTELDPEILKHSRIALEYYPQTKDEGEIQNLEVEPEYTELYELIQNKKPGRTEQDKIIVFDSVGFALADYSIMRMVYENGLGQDIDLLPDMPDPKNLYEFIAK